MDVRLPHEWSKTPPAHACKWCKLPHPTSVITPLLPPETAELSVKILDEECPVRLRWALEEIMVEPPASRPGAALPEVEDIQVVVVQHRPGVSGLTREYDTLYINTLKLLRGCFGYRLDKCQKVLEILLEECLRVELDVPRTKMGLFEELLPVSVLTRAQGTPDPATISPSARRVWEALQKQPRVLAEIRQILLGGLWP